MKSRVFWSSLWLAVVLVTVKAYHLGVPHLFSLTDSVHYLRSLAAISYTDVLFTGILWAMGRGLLILAGARVWAQRVLTLGVLILSAFFSIYAIANVLIFGIFGGFLTYPLLQLVGSVRMLSSSASAYLTPGVIAAFVAVPLLYLALIEASSRLAATPRGAGPKARGLALACFLTWLAFGAYTYSADWTTKQDRRIAENPEWVFVSSWFQAITGNGTVRLTDKFPAEDLQDFEPFGPQKPNAPVTLRRVSSAMTDAAQAGRPLNVILIVLEAVGARWTSLNPGPYTSTTPVLQKESNQGIVFDNFYAHIGRSSNSLVAMLMSAYPKLGFRDITEEYPLLPGTSLAEVFRDRGYRTAFITSSDLSWAGWGPFLKTHGFSELDDYHQLACSPMTSSWGVEDRCMVGGINDFISKDASHPFFVMGWTTQTHHPYEPTPNVPQIPFANEPGPDQYEVDRYLNVLHETDKNLANIFDRVRELGLEKDTLIVVVGDHGQAFGYPHDTYVQGRTVFEEDVHIPLLFWFPRQFQKPTRANNIGSHVDLAPSIAELAGIAPAPGWQGRSLFSAEHPPRAYFYVAEDHFTLGVREGKWKYMLDLREGVDQLFDVEADPNEQNNLARSQPELCARLRQRLAAWTEANRRQYERIDHP